MGEVKDDFSLLNLIQNKLLITFLKLLNILSFLFANAVVFLTFIKFLNISLTNAIVLFIVGLLFQIIILYPSLLWKISFPKNLVKRIIFPTDKLSLTLYNLAQEMKKQLRIFVLLPRLFFFNVLKELFMVILVWTSFLGLLFLTGFLEISGAPQLLFNILSVLGILSGLFQFYIQYYKKQLISKIAVGLAKVLKSVTQISFYDFLGYLDNSNKDLKRAIENTLRRDTWKILSETIRFFGRNSDITQIILNTNTCNDLVISGIVEHNLNPKQLKALLKEYQTFFEKHNGRVRGEIDEMDLSELKQIVLSNVVFFDEVIAQVLQSKLQMDVNISEEPKSYRDFFEKSIYSNVDYLLKKLGE